MISSEENIIKSGPRRPFFENKRKENGRATTLSNGEIRKGIPMKIRSLDNTGRANGFRGRVFLAFEAGEGRGSFHQQQDEQSGFESSFISPSP
jgi:hypothetical protein